ncbi:MAG: T9SS C-terminal target domain-containing protein [Saprospirales bacterium]|nr:MAG: T9SS C-terminal target domain-containing protein [Saprospirales bacterium]
MKQTLLLQSLKIILLLAILPYYSSSHILAEDAMILQPPMNDECEGAEIIQTGVDSSVWCGAGTNINASPADIDPDDVEVLNPFFSQYIIEAVDPESAAVWYDIPTDSVTGRMDIEVVFDTADTDARIILLQAIDGCDSLLFIQTTTPNLSGEIFLERENIEPNADYKLLLYSSESQAGGFELCVNLKAPLFCDRDIVSYYNHAEVHCGMDGLFEYCIQLDEPVMLETFPGCDSCCYITNPHWLVFQIGQIPNDLLNLQIEVRECINNQGAQIALYELGSDVNFDPTGSEDGLLPTEDMLLSDCGYVTHPLKGYVDFEVDGVSDGLYGLLFTGWAQDQCQIVIREVMEGSGLPYIDSLDAPVLDRKLGPWDKDYKVCPGALDVPFTIVEEVHGAYSYIWTLDGEVIDGVEGQQEIFLDFPETGEYEICVFATNHCVSSESDCVEIVVHPLDPFILHDTICIRETYEWEGLFGPIGPGSLGPFTYEGDTVFLEESINYFGCPIDAELYLHVVGDNYHNPTHRNAVICQGETYYIPEEGHPEAIPFNETGIYGEMPDRDVFITQQAAPGSLYECDSFFVLDLAVISLDVFGFLEHCVDSVFTLCTEAPGVVFLDMGVHELDTEFTWEWVRNSDGEVLASGDNSDGNLICVDLNITDFLDPVEESLQFKMSANIEGEPMPAGCDFEVPWTVILSNYMPMTPEVEIEEVYYTDETISLEVSNPQFIDIDYQWTFSRDPDTIITHFHGESLDVVFSEPGKVEVCVKGINDCSSSEAHCFELEIDQEVTVPPTEEKDVRIEWFPNPVKDQLHIRSSTAIGETEIKVYDMRGSVVKQKTVEIGEEYQLNTAGLSSGVYLIKLVYEDGIARHMMVKQE